MTEATGGSDVGLTETVARHEERRAWRLYGRKWFTSAIASQMALTLARPEGNPPGGKGLALFYVETRDAHGRPERASSSNRLKDKLGTRKVPTAELTLEGTPAELVCGTRRRREAHRADAQRHAHLEQRERGCAHAPRARPRARLRATAASHSARRSPRSRCTSTRSPACRPNTRPRFISRSSWSSCSGGCESGQARAPSRPISCAS